MKRYPMGLVVLLLVLAGILFILGKSNRGPATVNEPAAAVHREPTAVHGAELQQPPSERNPVVVDRTPKTLDTPPVEKWPGAFTVFGVLLNEELLPIDEAACDVRFWDTFGQSVRAELASGGRYRTNLTPGEWRAEAWAFGFRVATQDLSLLPASFPHRQDFVLSSVRSVHVRLMAPDGRGLFEAMRDLALHSSDLAAMKSQLSVSVATEFGGSKEPYACFHTRAYLNGRGLDLPQACLGVLELADSRPVTAVLQLSDEVIAQTSVPPSATEIEFFLLPSILASHLAVIDFAVIDAITKAQLREGLATITGPGPNTKQIPLRGDSVEIRGWPPGSVRLVVQKEGYEVYETEFKALPGQVTDLGDIALQPALLIQGIVLDPGGLPVSKVHITRGVIKEAGNGNAILDSKGLFMTQEDGTFEIPVRSGKYLLRVHSQPHQHPMVSGSLLVDTSLGSVVGLELHVEPPVIVTVSIPNTAGTAPNRLRIVDRFGLTIEEMSPVDRYSWSLRLPRGTFQLEALSADGRVVEARELEVLQEAIAVELRGQ